MHTTLYAYCENDPVNNSDPLGYLYISNRTLVDIVCVILLSSFLNPVATTFVAIGAYKLYMIIVATAAILGAKISSFGGPVLSWAVGGILALAVGFSGWTIVDALLQGKGINIGFKRTWWGMIYGIEISVQ